MKKQTQDQFAGTNLRVGDRIVLKVGIRPGTEKPGFIPQFMDKDNLLATAYMGFGSIRIFIPNNQAQIEDGEVWEVKITSHNVSKMENMTRDHRLYVYINVDVLARNERIVKSLDFTTNTLVEVKTSGTKILERKRLPFVVKSDGWYRRNGCAVCADIIYVENKAIDINISEKLTEKEFFTYWQKKLQKPLKPMAVKKLFDSYPKLPEAEVII